MKNLLRLLALAALAAAFALPALAQTTAASTATTTAQDDAAAKNALYQKFLDLKKQTSPEQQKVAYETAKEYLTKYGTPADEADKQIVDYIQKWVGRYEKAVRDFSFGEAFKNKNYTEVYNVGRQILGEQPENFAVVTTLVQAGVANAQAGNKSLNMDAVRFARQAVGLVESGRLTDLKPFASKDDALGYFNYSLGYLLRETSPAEAEAALLKAAQSGGSYKSEPNTFFYLANAIIDSEYKALAAEYNEKYAGKDPTPEGTAMLDRLNAITDRVIDAFARAVALSTKPDQQTFKTKMLAQLTDLYKGRHDGSDAGLNELIASVLTKPLPLPTQTAAAPAAVTP